MAKQRSVRVVSRSYALLCHRFYWVQYHFTVWQSRHRGAAISGVIILFFCVSAYLYPVLQSVLGTHFLDQQRLAGLRSLLLALGAALIGASVIAFSLVVFAMQINVERMPHGLFRKFSADTRIMTAFMGVFLLAISVTCTSLIPDISWVAIAVLVAMWGTVLIIGLFLYAYRRALLLINPLKQLSFVAEDASREMRVWVRRAKRAAPLLKETKPPHDDKNEPLSSTHDLPRIVYFQANPHWTAGAQQAIQHAISFARRYAERGDHEVSGAALGTLVNINRAYIEAKGKTFFGTHWMFDNPLSTDGFIDDTLEHLRQNLRVGIARGDEQQIEQTLQAMAVLVQVYIHIDYSDKFASKTHAHLAAGYLSEALKAVVPHNMPDVMMEGVRLMGQSAQLFLARGQPNDIATLADNIGLLACTGVVNESYRPVTLVAVEQLAVLTFDLILTKAGDIRFVLGQLKKNIAMVAKVFLTVPDTPLASVHSNYLGPYYSATSPQAFQARLTKLVNALAQAEANNKDAKTVIRNINVWADRIYQTEKELLLLAIDKRSHFTFDMMHWITHTSKLLLAFSNVPACEDHTKQELQKHARWLVFTLSWVPDDRETVAFVENYQMTEILFEAAMDVHYRGFHKFSEEASDLLLRWAFKAGKYQTGWAILERSIYGLATLALLNEASMGAENLKRRIAERLAQPDAPCQEIRDQTAWDIREEALYDLGYSLSPIEHAMSQVDYAKLRPLLGELANLLSPETAENR